MIRECEWFPEWVPCNACGGLPEGYGEWDGVSLSVEGVCYVAFSTEAGNTVPPTRYLGNEDPSKPWIVVPFAKLFTVLARKHYLGL